MYLALDKLYWLKDKKEWIEERTIKIFQANDFTKEDILEIAKKEFPEENISGYLTDYFTDFISIDESTNFAWDKFYIMPMILKYEGDYARYIKSEKQYLKGWGFKLSITTREDGCILLKAV